MAEDKKIEKSGSNELDSDLDNVSGGGMIQSASFMAIKKAAELSHKGVRGEEQQKAFDGYTKELEALNNKYTGKW